MATATEQDKFLDILRGMFDSALSTALATLTKMLRRDTILFRATGVTLTTTAALAETPFFYVDSERFPNGIRIIKTALVPETAVTADDTDYGIVVLSRRDGNNGTERTIWTTDTRAAHANGLAAHIVETFDQASAVDPIDKTYWDCAAGSVLYMEYTKAGSGVNFTGLGVAITYEVL